MKPGESHFYITNSVVEEEIKRHARKVVGMGGKAFIHYHASNEGCLVECRQFEE